MLVLHPDLDTGGQVRQMVAPRGLAETVLAQDKQDYTKVLAGALGTVRVLSL